MLSYPPESADWGPCIKGEMAWLKHLKYWQFTAQDELHVFIDKSSYSSFSAAASIPKDDSRELNYVLKHGSKFPDKFQVAEVRAGMCTGHLPNDRVSVQSSKRE